MEGGTERWRDDNTLWVEGLKLTTVGISHFSPGASWLSLNIVAMFA